MTLRSILIKNLERDAKALKRQALQARHDPCKKNIHQLRITVRRVRAVLWLIEHGSSHLSFRKLKANLRNLGHALGRLREIDVAIQDAKKYHLRVTRLKNKRQAARKSLRGTLGRRRLLKISSGLDKTIFKINECQKLDVRSAASLLQNRVRPWKHKRLKTDDDFHSLRIATKKTRYILESIGRPAQPLRDLQEILGKGHDLEMLQEFSGKNPMLYSEISKQYRQARRLSQSTIRFALNSLENVAKTQGVVDNL